MKYFRLADMNKLLKEMDKWARRRIRAVYWKQWKKIKTKNRRVPNGMHGGVRGRLIKMISLLLDYVY